MIKVLPAAVVMLALAGGAAGQTPAPAQASSTSPIGSLVAAGDRVSITTADGVIRQGLVLSLTRGTLELQLDHSKLKQTVPFDRLRRVDIRFHDRLTDGLGVGVLAGVVAGAIIGTISVTAECHDRDALQSCTAAEIFGALAVGSGVGAAAGAAIGMVADAMHLSTREVWRAPGPVAIAWAPIVTPRRAGLRFTMRW